MNPKNPKPDWCCSYFECTRSWVHGVYALRGRKLCRIHHERLRKELIEALELWLHGGCSITTVSDIKE